MSYGNESIIIHTHHKIHQTRVSYCLSDKRFSRQSNSAHITAYKIASKQIMKSL